MEWIEKNIIEIVGASLALLYIVLEIKARWTMWLVGIFSSLFYVYIFYRSGVYAQAGLNFYFLLVNAYGLYYWKYARSKEKEPLKITHLNRKSAVFLVFVALILSVFIGKMLDMYTDSPVPYPDAILAALGLIASWMVARKILEHWYIWICVNLSSAALYYYLEMYPTAVLYAIYGIMSFIGWKEWKEAMRKESCENKI